MCYLKQIIFCEIDQGCFLQVYWQGHEVERRRLRGFEEEVERRKIDKQPLV